MGQKWATVSPRVRGGDTDCHGAHGQEKRRILAPPCPNSHPVSRDIGIVCALSPVAFGAFLKVALTWPSEHAPAVRTC